MRLARYFRHDSTDNSVVVFDNLHRRGSEWNLDGLRSEGVTFVHGDVRNPADLEALDGTFDVLIEASAEASVHAGIAELSPLRAGYKSSGRPELSRIRSQALRRLRLPFKLPCLFHRASDAITPGRVVNSI